MKPVRELQIGERVTTRFHGPGVVTVREMVEGRVTGQPVPTGRYGIILDDTTRFTYSPAYFYPEEILND